MISTINKNDKASLCIQLKNILAGEIREGRLKANERIPGERVIAEKYGVSRGTAVEALKLLEEEGYLERIATKGTFVSDNAARRIATPKILFPSPEKSISPEHLNYSNWCASSEIYQGIMHGALEYGMQISFQYFEDLKDRNEVNRQLKTVRGFDGAVFVGPQLSAMREIFDEESIPYVLVGNSGDADILSYVYYKRMDGLRMLAEYVSNHGYRRIGFLRNINVDNESREKIEFLANALSQKGVEVAPEWTFHLEDDKSKAYEKLRKEFPANLKGVPEIFFCESVTHPFALYKLLADFRLRAGTDIAVISHGGKNSFSGLIPSLTYLQIPYFEMGKEACNILNKKIRGLPLEKSYSMIDANLIEGESTLNMIKAR